MRTLMPNHSSARTYAVRCLAALSTLTVMIAGCYPQAHSPQVGSTRTEDESQVVYNHSWLKSAVLLRNMQVEHIDGNRLKIVAQLHSQEPHVSRRVNVRTEFYAPSMADGGTVVDATEWQELVLEPRKRVQYAVNSLKAADDFRIYVYYDEDLGKR